VTMFWTSAATSYEFRGGRAPHWSSRRLDHAEDRREVERRPPTRWSPPRAKTATMVTPVTQLDGRAAGVVADEDEAAASHRDPRRNEQTAAD